jgi:parallel beta-helix repeat protein
VWLFSPLTPVSYALTPRAPIHIVGNGDFTPAKGVVSGEGTYSDPYIIEGWDIDASSNHGIWIEYTTDYFIVRNCYVHEGAPNYHGVYLYKVYNGRIENVESSWNLWGMVVWASGSEGYGNSIVDCYLHENWWSGVYLYKSTYTTLEGNVLTNTEDGIYIHRGSNNAFTDNEVMHCSPGFYLEETDNNTFTGNTANTNDYYGFYVYYSENNEFTGNTANNNNAGILLDNSSNNTLNGNTANNILYGILLDSSSNNTLLGNTVENNWWDGIDIENSDDNTVDGNSANNNGNGINIFASDGNTLTSNTANNNKVGIHFDSSNGNTLTSNTANNNNYGLVVAASSYNTLNGNTANNNNYDGIRLQSVSNNNNVVSNACYDNTNYDIYNEGTGNTFQYNSYDTSSGV